MKAHAQPCCYLCADVGEFPRTDRGVPVCDLCATAFLNPPVSDAPEARPTPAVFSPGRGVFEMPDDVGFP